MSFIAFLRPTKAKIIGTLLLLVADWIAGFASQQIAQSMVPPDLIETLTPAFREAFSGAGLMQLMYLGLVMLIVDFILKLLLFYITVSFTIEKLVKK